jgi:hypothetical protein
MDWAANRLLRRPPGINDNVAARINRKAPAHPPDRAGQAKFAWRIEEQQHLLPGAVGNIRVTDFTVPENM